MRIAMLLSGGVDSSVALRLLQRRGHEVEAFYLKIWLEDELSFLGECPWEEDLGFARAVCAQAEVPLEVVSLQREYHDRVVSWAIGELRRGRTPSPDILCNQHIKFGAFLDLLEGRLGTGFDRVASGHYARLKEQGGRIELWRGKDPVKDQTYFLYQLDQQQLRRCLFPLGDLEKSEVRKLARDLDLPNRERKDSQGICFLGKIQYDAFVRAHLGEKPGAIRRASDGELLGKHPGHWFFTVGQRKGLGLGGGPWYVVGKDPESNTVWISHKDRHDDHHRSRFHIAEPHWIDGAPDPGEHEIRVKIRHSPQTPPARMIVPEGTGEPVGVELQTPDPGIADGQAAVLYRGDRCLGGGQIGTPTPFAP